MLINAFNGRSKGGTRKREWEHESFVPCLFESFVDMLLLMKKFVKTCNLVFVEVALV